MEPILKVENLKTFFPVSVSFLGKKKYLKAVNDVSFEVFENETFGLVGESGCGKSTLGRTIVKIYDPTEGKVWFKGKDISTLKGEDLKKFRKEAQMIFQDPYASLNARMTVGEIIKEPMDIHGLYSSNKEKEEKASELLEIVGLKPDHIRRYPHEFSGGQRQRISIARTLALDPSFIVCDEPISALDVSIQAQIINLLEKIQAERNISYLFIAHDLGAVKHISKRIGAMYLGSLVEVGDSNELYHNPLHPYTKALLSAIPIPDPRVMRSRESVAIDGEIPSPLNVPTGCAFRTRCPMAMAKCAEDTPKLKKVGNSMVACHLYD
ncbi:MAG: ATP-binding cassette domain-containing protein [Clostridia bacterium]|nr:ATP-binding cassette domain-containing protein [Clostridia bacterium]MBQ7094569.1 ATP-binding cassette domain-containing protein [Clostridia bacterium]